MTKHLLFILLLMPNVIYAQQEDIRVNQLGYYPEAPKIQNFSPELITRLTERIKKL